jgi:DNA-binding response OmpR family regulator
MARILSISYQEALLVTRQMLLQQRGYEVVSGLGFVEAVMHCERGGFDLLLLGHTVPQLDKEKLIALFRQHCNAPVLSLQRTRETPLDGAEHHALSDTPHELLEKIDVILHNAGK